MPKKPKDHAIRITQEAAMILRAYCDLKGLKLGQGLSAIIRDHVKPMMMPKIQGTSDVRE